MKTTFRKLIKYRPRKNRWSKLCNNILCTDFPESPESLDECQLSDEQLDTSVSILEILESNGVKDAFWALRTQEYKDYCLIAADVLKSVLPFLGKCNSGDNRLLIVIDTIGKWYAGEVSDKELRHAGAPAAYGYTYPIDAVLDYVAATERKNQWEINERILRRHFGCDSCIDRCRHYKKGGSCFIRTEKRPWKMEIRAMVKPEKLLRKQLKNDGYRQDSLGFLSKTDDNLCSFTFSPKMFACCGKELVVNSVSGIYDYIGDDGSCWLEQWFVPRTIRTDKIRMHIEKAKEMLE